jgi:hypothetical protein
MWDFAVTPMEDPENIKENNEIADEQSHYVTSGGFSKSS